jgi:hypothetical protein
MVLTAPVLPLREAAVFLRRWHAPPKPPTRRPTRQKRVAGSKCASAVAPDVVARRRSGESIRCPGNSGGVERAWPRQSIIINAPSEMQFRRTLRKRSR